MYLFCASHGEIYGCVKNKKKKVECLGCIHKEDCPVDTLYPRENVKVDICQHCRTKAIWKIHDQRHGTTH